MRFLALALCLVLRPAFALDAGETKVQIKEVTKANKVEGDLDQEISNLKLRAESGSKSKWSMSATANYRGGSVSSRLGGEAGSFGLT